MKIKSNLIYAICLLLFILISLNQAYSKDGEKVEDNIVQLFQSLDDSKTIVLLETNDFVVKTSLTQLEIYFDLWHEKYPELESNRNFIIKIKQRHYFTTIYLEEIAKELNREMRLNFIIADLLENGHCFILNKKNGKTIKEIKMQTYSFDCGVLCGEGGRRYFINDTILFKVVDWVS